MRPVRPLHVVIVKGEHFKTCPKQRNTVVKFVKLVHLPFNRVKPVVKFVHPVDIWSMMVYCWVITIKQVIVNNAKQEHFYKTMLPQYPTILLRLIVSLARLVDINHILVQRHVHCAVLVLRTMKSKQPPLRSVNLVLLRLTRTNKANNIVRHLLPVCLFVFFLLIFFDVLTCLYSCILVCRIAQVKNARRVTTIHKLPVPHVAIVKLVKKKEVRSHIPRRYPTVFNDKFVMNALQQSTTIKMLKAIAKIAPMGGFKRTRKRFHVLLARLANTKLETICFVSDRSSDQ